MFVYKNSTVIGFQTGKKIKFLFRQFLIIVINDFHQVIFFIFNKALFRIKRDAGTLKKTTVNSSASLLDENNRIIDVLARHRFEIQRDM